MEENGADIELVELWIVINEGVVSNIKSSVSLVYFAVSYRTRNRIFNLCGLMQAVMEIVVIDIYA